MISGNGWTNRRLGFGRVRRALESAFPITTGDHSHEPSAFPSAACSSFAQSQGTRGSRIMRSFQAELKITFIPENPPGRRRRLAPQSVITIVYQHHGER
jgi:hypothetical protein